MAIRWCSRRPDAPGVSVARGARMILNRARRAYWGNRADQCIEDRRPGWGTRRKCRDPGPARWAIQWMPEGLLIRHGLRQGGRVFAVRKPDDALRLECARFLVIRGKVPSRRTLDMRCARKAAPQAAAAPTKRGPEPALPGRRPAVCAAECDCAAWVPVAGRP